MELDNTLKVIHNERNHTQQQPTTTSTDHNHTGSNVDTDNAPNGSAKAVFSLIVPYKLGKTYSDRMAMMDELANSLPDRKDLEVIWVDDGSETPWNSPKAKHTVHKQVHNLPGQRYAGTARNTGISHATGTWVLFCDSDDLIDTQTLNDLMDIIQAAGDTHEQTKAWFGPMTSFHTYTHQIGERHIHTNSVLKHAQKTGDTGRLAHHYSPCGKIVRRDFIDTHNIRFGVWKVGEDAFFSVQVALALDKVAYYHTPYYRIREGHESLMSLPHDDSVRAVFASHRSVQQILKKAKRADLRNGAEGYVKNYIRTNPKVVLAEIPRTLYEGALFHPMRHYLRRLKKALYTTKTGKTP